MRYWDSLALVARHVEQAATPRVRDLYAADPEIPTWLLSDVEVRSGIARLGRDGVLSTDELQTAGALQLGAALASVYDDPHGWEFVCIDQGLGAAA